jgi:hypothetical protein
MSCSDTCGAIIPAWAPDWVRIVKPDEPLYLEPLVSGRPWYIHCCFCGLDEGGQHHDSCLWYSLVSGWEWTEIERVDDEQRAEAEARREERRRQEHEWAIRYRDDDY